MIKNIVFDIGNVLFEFKPERHFAYLPDGEKVCKYIFTSPLWLAYDLGEMHLDEVEARLITQYPKHEATISLMLSKWTEVLKPKRSMEMIEQLKQQGYRIYLLSNLSYDAADYIQQTYKLFDKVDGYVLSCEVHRVKPNLEIYEILSSQYALNYKETIFLDDLEENVRAAERLGMYGIHYTDDETVQTQLNKLGNERCYAT